MVRISPNQLLYLLNSRYVPLPIITLKNSSFHDAKFVMTPVETVAVVMKDSDAAIEDCRGKDFNYQCHLNIEIL